MPESGLGGRVLRALRDVRLRSYLRSKTRRRWDIDYTIDVIRTMKNWRAVLLEDQIKRLGPAEYALRNGVRYYVRPGTADRDIMLEIWNERCYTPAGFEISPTDVVVDIGAHIGVFSVFASRLASNGRVYSVEPVPENFEMLKRNLAANGMKHAVPLNLAVSDKRGVMDLFLSGGNTGGHSLLSTFGGDAVTSRISVKTASLADLMSENAISRIDFLKMDCEGAEYAILYSCPDKVLNSIRKISMEYHDIDVGTRNGKAMKAFLESKGFRVDVRTDGWQLLYAVRK